MLRGVRALLLRLRSIASMLVSALRCLICGAAAGIQGDSESATRPAALTNDDGTGAGPCLARRPSHQSSALPGTRRWGDDDDGEGFVDPLAPLSITEPSSNPALKSKESRISMFVLFQARLRVAAY